MTLSTYLTFDGNCREAFEFYRSVFGGDFEVIQTFGDGPDGMPVPEDERDRVMHVSYPIGTSVLMGSDSLSSSPEATQIGNNFSISYLSTSREETDELFAKISEGGVAVAPLEEMFWGAYFGACTDKFGINWQFNCELQPPQSG